MEVDMLLKTFTGVEIAATLSGVAARRHVTTPLQRK